MAEPVLRVNGLTKRYGGVVAVDDLSFGLPAGSTLGVIGPNGAGKSTLLGMVAGSIRPTSGRVVFDNEDVTGRKTHVLCRRGLARTYQLSRPLGELTVEENLSVAARFGGDGTRDVGDVLELCGLAPKAGVLAPDLSHAEQRRLELGRALATKPRVMLLDEVGAGLREREIAELRDLIAVIQARGVAVVIVEHIMSLVMRVSDRVLVMENGRAIAEGPPEEVVENADVIAAYLGRDED